MINLEPIIVSIILCLLCGLFYCRDSERPTLKRFIYASLITAIILVASVLAIYFAKLLFKVLPDWLAFSAFLIIGVGSLGAITIFFCRGIIQDLVKRGEPILMKTKNIVSAIFGFCIVACVIGGLVFWQIQKHKRKTNERDTIKQTVSDMVTTHNASTQWSKHFVDYSIKINGGHRPIYTTDVKSALITNDSKPILFYGGIVDVTNIDAEYYLLFDTIKDVDITFKLRCDKERAERAMSTPEGFYAVVAVISDIKSSDFETDTHHSSAPDVIIINSFIAKGVCLDFMFLGRDFNPFEFVLSPEHEKLEDSNLPYDHELEEKLIREFRKR
jgi:heme/copper-type cytochrome/quinol oxidase subunit 4